MEANRVSYKDILLFVVSPLVAAINSLTKRKNIGHYFVLFLFTSYFAFVIRPEGEGQDLYRYMESLYNLRANSIGDVLMMYFSGELEDPFVPLLQVLVSMYTFDGHIFLFLCGIILGIFFSLSIRLFPCSNDRYTILIVWIFSFIVGLDRLGGVRNIMAFYVFFWSVSSFFRSNNMYYLLGLLFAISIHYSVILYTVIFFASLLLQRRQNLLTNIAIVTFILSLALETIDMNFSFGFLGEAINEKAGAYTDGRIGEELTNSMKQLNWQVRFETPMLRYGLIAIMLYLRKNILQQLTVEQNKLYACILTFIICCNVFSSVPDLSGWIVMFSFAFMVYFLSLIMPQISQTRRNTICLVTLAFSLLHIVYTMKKITFILDVSDIILPIFI